MTIKYVLSVVGALGVGIAIATPWSARAGKSISPTVRSEAPASRSEAAPADDLRRMMRQEFARVRAEVADLKATQAAASARAPEQPAPAEPVVDPEVEERREVAYTATSDLLRSGLATGRWLREDEMKWREASVDLTPDQYAELRYRLLAAMRSGELDASDLDRPN